MTPPPRPPHHHYHDPLSLVWIQAAARTGFRIARSDEVYASTDGKGTILIADDRLMDADDNLAQMILHELCHALVEGEAGQTQVDWGLGHQAGSDPWREHACLRLQAHLAGRYGLRDFFAPTTDFRLSFWDGLPEDPFWAEPARGGRRERSCVAARKGFFRARHPAWWQPLDQALRATAVMAELLRNEEGESSPAPTRDELPTLWSTPQTPPPLHPAGHASLATGFGAGTCGDCGWLFRQRGFYRCRQSPAARLDSDLPACVNHEPRQALDCQDCGACCREAYHSVEISRREPLIKRHPELVVKMETHLKLKRAGNRCAALEGGHQPDEAYACAIYEDRPKTCQAFESGGSHCLEARRRVGLSL